MGLADRIAVGKEDELGLDEVKRIISLPVLRPLEAREVDEVSRCELTCEAWDEGIRLWEPQARGTLSFQADRGLFAPLRVAGGKSAISYLTLKHALQRLKLGKALLIVPSDLVSKAVTRDVPKMRKWIGLTAPVHVMSGLPPARRLALARTGWRGIYVYSYSLLQREQADEELALIAPEICVCDEAHALAHVKTAAQTKRWLRMMLETKALSVNLSGTMAKRSLLNYAHLALLALGDKCPLPRGRGELETWASALDEVKGGMEWLEDKQVDDMKGLEPMRLWAVDRVRDGTFEPDEVGGTLTPDVFGYQRAFRLRRNSAPAVISSSEDAVGTSLKVKNTPPLLPMTDSEIDAFEQELEGKFTGEEDFVPSKAFSDLPPFKRLLALIWAAGGITKKSKGRGTTPNGDPIQYAIHAFKWLYELSTGGFYNELVWPEAGKLVEQRGVSAAEAERLLAAAKDHHEAERKYHKRLRKFLTEEDHVPGLDTPVLVGRACSLGGRGLSERLVDMWREKEALDFEGRPLRTDRAVPVCDWKIRAALEWAKALPEGKGALVWTQNQEVGRWAAEIFLAELGPDRFIHCPSGRKHDEVIQAPETANKVVIAALGGGTGGHAKGKDLQASFSENYFLQFPRSADLAEQAMGRTHRYGQPAEELVMHTNLALPFDHACFNATLADALWLHRTEGEQKLIYADHVETPKLHPTEFLVQQGFDMLAKRDMEQALREVFAEKQVVQQP